MTRPLSPVRRDPERRQGLPCIRGHRIPVRAIKSLSRDGYSAERIVREYPGMGGA